MYMTFTSEIMALTSQKKEFVFHNYFNSSNHNPEIIWRVRRKLMHVRATLTTMLFTMKAVHTNRCPVFLQAKIIMVWVPSELIIHI